MKTLFVSTTARNQIIDITKQVQKVVAENNWRDGLLLVYCPHTTAAISVNENADPDVKTDMNAYLKKLVPQQAGFDHAEGNSDAHIKGSLVGFSQTFIVENKKLLLGTWQGIYFMEFDGPRKREVWVKFVGEK
jgi:secondary thiamine-phosphate synthase enzyme